MDQELLTGANLQRVAENLFGGERGYRERGPLALPASSFPDWQNDALIGRICECVTLPVNVMVMGGVPSNDRLSDLGVSRISYGPIPYISAMSALQQEAKKLLS